VYKIKLSSKEAEKLEVVNFKDIEQKEFDIETWVNDNPSILNEDLLIISEQTLLPSGRLPDLVALDKEGNLVIIELKRDDSGREVYWQAITYAAQLSEYSFNDIINLYEDYLNKKGKISINSSDEIEEFIEIDIEQINQKQRLILVSKEFHQDVLKASLWLLDYGLDLKIIKLTPYQYSEDLILLDSEVMIPTPGVEDYIERKAEKVKKAERSYNTAWWSLKKGNYSDTELKERLYQSFTRESNLTPRLNAFFEILLSKDEFFNRITIKEKLYEEYNFGNNIGQAGRFLSNVSQYITKKGNDHLRQVLEFEMPHGTEGEIKDNYKLVSNYRDLVREVLVQIESEVRKFN